MEKTEEYSEILKIKLESIIPNLRIRLDYTIFQCKIKRFVVSLDKQ